MTQGNFNWFLHTMLFYHTQHVIDRQTRKDSMPTNGSGDEGEGDGGV
jgi:hypothetical protein